jgi:hypothetical protein
LKEFIQRSFVLDALGNVKRRVSDVYVRCRGRHDRRYTEAFVNSVFLFVHKNRVR